MCIGLDLINPPVVPSAARSAVPSALAYSQLGSVPCVET